MFIINIIKTIGSITSIYIIRFNSGVYTDTNFKSNTNLGFSFNNIVTRKV